MLAVDSWLAAISAFLVSGAAVVLAIGVLYRAVVVILRKCDEILDRLRVLHELSNPPDPPEVPPGGTSVPSKRPSKRKGTAT